MIALPMPAHVTHPKGSFPSGGDMIVLAGLAFLAGFFVIGPAVHRAMGG